MDKRHSFAKNLIKILVRRGFIDEHKAQDILSAFKDTTKDYFDDFLLEEGIIEEEHLLQALGDLYRVPAIDVTGIFFQPFVLHKFPKDVLHRYACIPMDTDGEIMTVIASEPDDPRLLPILGGYVSYDIVFRVGLRRHITDAISEFYDRSITELPESLDEEHEAGLGAQQGDDDIIL